MPSCGGTSSVPPLYDFVHYGSGQLDQPGMLRLLPDQRFLRIVDLKMSANLILNGLLGVNSRDAEPLQIFVNLSTYFTESEGASQVRAKSCAYEALHVC